MLTREEILSMPVGRELDIAVATTIMGYTTDRHRQGLVSKDRQSTFPKQYSSDISAAFEVVEKMGDKGWMLYKVGHTLSKDGNGKITGYTCIFLNIESGASREVSEVSLPKAISKAALLAVIES